MALDSTWWATGYAGVRWDISYSGSSAINNILAGDNWNRLDISAITDLGAVTNWGNSSMMNKDFGYFFAEKDTDATVVIIMSYVGVSAGSDVPKDPDVGGELPKPDPDGPDANYWVPTGDRGTGAAKIWWQSGGSDTYSVKQYQAHCWNGNPAEVMGAIVRYLGLGTDYIDMTNWSTTHTQQEGLTTEPVLFFRRIIGERVAESLKRLARHCYDILCVNMAGKLALISRDSPPTGPTALTPSMVVSSSWRYAREYMVNYCAATHGQWVYGQSYADVDDYPTAAAWHANTQWDSAARADYRGLLIDIGEDSAAQTKYGLKVLSSQDAAILEDGVEVTRPTYHFPHFYDKDCKDAILGRISGGQESGLRRELTVVQDFRGLDYDIGYKVAGIALTIDGDTITDARCIAKVVDFDNLTVESTLLEELS